MSSLESDFDELKFRIRHGRDLDYASFEPIFYLVFDPKLIIKVKRYTPAWISNLRNEGWDVHQFSIAEEIRSIHVNDPRRKLWVNADRKAPLKWNDTNKSLSNVLINNDVLQKKFESFLESLEGNKMALVLVTDLEALHPYLRIGAIETNLQGKFHVPAIFLYPGKRAGKTKLKFLGFYPEDGNYRSVHVGG